MAKVWALHTLSPDLAHTEVAKKVTKVGGGHPSAMARRMRALKGARRLAREIRIAERFQIGAQLR